MHPLMSNYYRISRVHVTWNPRLSMMIFIKKKKRNSVFRNDYIMRQIDSLVMVVAKIFFGKTTPVYERQDEINPTSGDRLHDELMDLVEMNRINEAENLLFEHLGTGIEGGLSLALNFYHRLNLLTDEQLAVAEFSRGEIDAGLRDVIKLLGLSAVLENSANIE
jgi:hypothetical protein